MCTELFVRTYIYRHIYIYIYVIYLVVSSDAYFNNILQLFFHFQIVCVTSHVELPRKMAITEVASCMEGSVGGGGGLEWELVFGF